MLTNKSQARVVRDRRLELVTKSALGLNQEKEIAMHLLFDESPEPVLSSDTKAITAIANNQSEHTYIRALACALLTRLYSFQEKVVRANAWSETLASLLETLTPEQRKEKVWARVKYTPDGPVYGQVSVQQYINNVGSMIGHIMVPPPGEKEIMEARTPLDVNPHIMMSDDLKGALLDLCSHGAIPETFC
ncbi:hypothetical protein HDU79_011280 [Rhizoclosmatium sp. JEL0117]|nr:hypothetical protein HDU79_011280 [Rhizoclosmatium sp. JEL0117]